MAIVFGSREAAELLNKDKELQRIGIVSELFEDGSFDKDEAISILAAVDEAQDAVDEAESALEEAESDYDNLVDYIMIESGMSMEVVRIALKELLK